MKAFIWICVFIVIFVFAYSIHFRRKHNFDPTFLESITSKISEIQTEFTFDYRNITDFYNLNYTKFFDIPFVSNSKQGYSIFRSLADHIIVTNVSILQPHLVHCGDIIFVKTDFLQNFFETFHSKIKTQYILITHESDYSVGHPEQLKYLNDPKLYMWFGENIIYNHSKLKPLPIGIYVSQNNFFSTINVLAQTIIPFYQRKTLLYLNFSPETNLNRSTTLQYFKKTFGSFSYALFETKRIEWSEYLRKLKYTRFVVSPPGNGIDCHRTWEALAMGAVPIVLKTELQPLYDDMPVMVVNDWTEVTEANMEKFEHNVIRNLSKDGVPWRPKLWLRYWINEIINVKTNFVSNKCNYN